jgi:hypothetical protein
MFRTAQQVQVPCALSTPPLRQSEMQASPLVCTWGGSSVSSCSSCSGKVLALVQARFLWHFPYLERIQGVLDGVRRAPGTPWVSGPGAHPPLGTRTRRSTWRKYTVSIGVLYGGTVYLSL